MSHLFRTFFVSFLMLFVVEASAAQPAKGKPKVSTDSKGTTDFQRTKMRIDALLIQRLKPEPLPEVLPNPFQLADTATPPTDKNPKPVEALPVSSDSEMLLYYGASLKISGTVRISDKTHLIINQAPYKEGDIFTLKTKDGPAKLRIVAIAPGELTLGLNDAVQVIKFRK